MLVFSDHDDQRRHKPGLCCVQVPETTVHQGLRSRPSFSGRPAQDVPERPPPLRGLEHHEDPKADSPGAEGRGDAIHHLRIQHESQVSRHRLYGNHQPIDFPAPASPRGAPVRPDPPRDLPGPVPVPVQFTFVSIFPVAIRDSNKRPRGATALPAAVPISSV